MFPYFASFIIFITLSYILEAYLDFRQRKNLMIKDVPEKLKKYNLVTQEEFQKSQAYGLEKSNFELLADANEFLHNMAFILLGGLPIFWAYSLIIMQKFGYTSDYEFVHSVIFIAIQALFNTTLALPFELYGIFVIEENHGFNKQTLGLFLTDKLKGLALMAVIGVPILYVMLYMIKWGGPYFWLYLWIFVVAFSLIMTMLYPTLIAPIFNKFEPLPEGELRDDIYALSKRVDFPLTKLYKVDGSRRSAHSNAYFYGFFKNKRIVLYDTLLEQVDNKGIISVLAHELGHFKMGHTYKNLIITFAYMLVFFFLFGQSINNTDLYRSFGFATQPALVGLTLFSYIYAPVEHVFSFAMHALSRHFEYQADEYAVKLGYDLTDALAKLSTSNRSSLVIDKFYSAYHHTHPTLVERIDHISEMKKKHQKKAE